MSYRYAKTEDIEGVRKVKWDGLWHVLYKWGGKDTYDRVGKRTAMSVLKKIEKHRKAPSHNKAMESQDDN